MKIGDKVRFLSESGGGVVAGFQGNKIVLVEDEDGFQIPTAINDMRPIKTGRDAVREALRYIDNSLSEIVDIESDELNFRQRDKLRRKVIRYLLYGDRRRTNNDEQLQAVFEYIVIMYIEPEEIF